MFHGSVLSCFFRFIWRRTLLLWFATSLYQRIFLYFTLLWNISTTQNITTLALGVIKQMLTLLFCYFFFTHALQYSFQTPTKQCQNSQWYSHLSDPSRMTGTYCITCRKSYNDFCLKSRRVRCSWHQHLDHHYLDALSSEIFNCNSKLDDIV